MLTVGIAGVSLLPLWWVLVTSLREPGTEFLKPITLVPARPSWESYRTILGPDFRFHRAILNSLVVSSMVTLGALFLAGLSAYAIARLRFRYKVQSLYLILLAGLVPPIAVIAPTFVLVRALGLLGTLPGIILPNLAYNLPFSTWLLTAYFSTLPTELEEAAKIDGYPPLQVFWRVLLPLARPGLFATGALAFLGSWGEFMVAFSLSLGLPEVQTVPVAVLGMSRAFELQWAWVSAAIVLSVLPVGALVLIAQRWIMEGLTLGAIKG
jgi:ABC-type glycerol-3-phosphate transport system permease component